MKGYPIILENGKTIQLEKLQFNEKNFDEKWIQEVIFQNPQLIPTSEIRSVFGNQISIGREISTNAGYIDNLFINSDGYITIVETKLWRNPEARREVVAQIIDYAKELNKWSFQQLDSNVRQFNQNYNKTNEGIIEILSKYDSIDEKMLIDNIERNLRESKFLLLIVGDGIRENVQDMVEYLSQMPLLHFTLALVELQIFKTQIDEKDVRLIIPNIITRTKESEIARAIVSIKNVNSEQINVEIPENILSEKNIKTTSSKRYTISELDFFDILSQNVSENELSFTKELLAKCQSEGFFVEWTQKSFKIKYYNPELSGLKYTLFGISTEGIVYIVWFGDKLLNGNLKTINLNFINETAKLFDNVGIKDEKKWSRNPEISELKNVYIRFMELVDNLAKNIEIELLKIQDN